MTSISFLQEVEPLPELFWDPTPEIREQRLPRHLVEYNTQGEFESEKYVISCLDITYIILTSTCLYGDSWGHIMVVLCLWMMYNCSLKITFPHTGSG